MKTWKGLGIVRELECIFGLFGEGFDDRIGSIIPGHEFCDAFLVFLFVVALLIFCRKHN